MMRNFVIFLFKSKKKCVYLAGKYFYILCFTNFKVILNSNGKKLFKFIFDEENLSAQLNYKGKILINWTGKYVSKHRATFYQMQVLGYLPFHFYIKLQSMNKTIALNVDHFSAKIDKAVEKAKKEIAIKYNLSVTDIEEQQKLIKELTEKYAGQAIDEEIRAEIEKTVGEEIANAFISAIEDASGMAIDAAIEQEIANEVDAAIAEAVEMGVSAAAAAAAIEAMIWVYAMGGTDAEAMEACRYYAGDAC